jgi:hypothetical protein
MWAAIRNRFRDWYVLIIGLCIVCGGLYLASAAVSPPPATTTASDHKQQSQEQTPQNQNRGSEQKSAAPAKTAAKAFTRRGLSLTAGLCSRSTKLDTTNCVAAARAA